MSKILFGNYEPDIASVDMKTTSFVKNVVPRADGYGPFKDIGSFTDALPARCLGYISVLDSSSNSHLFAGTSTKLYKLNATTRAFEDVTRASGGNYSLGDREYWSFAPFGQNIVAVAAGNDPQVYDLGSSTKFAALAGSPPQARFATVVGDFLQLSGLTANPARIHWSDINNITNWTPGVGSSSDFQEFPSGGNAITVGGGEFGIVLQDYSIRRMIFNPGPTIFDFSIISEDRGIRMPYSLVKAQTSMFFYGTDGFYQIDATGALIPIGANKVNDTINAELDQTSPRFMIGAQDPVNHRAVWAYKSIGNTDPNFLDKMIMYDWTIARFATADIHLETIGIATPLATTLEGLDVLGGLDTLPYSLDSYVNTPKFQLAAFAPTHSAGFFDGAALEATMDTPEGAIGEGVRVTIKQVATISDAPAAYVKTASRETLYGTATYCIEQPINFRGYAPQRVSGRFNTGRVRIPAGTAWTFARGVDVDVSTVGKR